MKYLMTLDGDWIGAMQDDENYLYRISISGEELAFNSNTGNSLVEAGEKEIAHLEACKKAGKYMPFNKDMLIKTYEIY